MTTHKMEGGSNQNLNKPAKLRWSELKEDDGEDLDFLLPPKQIIGPDGNGMKKIIEYKFNEENKIVKITTTTRIRKIATRLSKRAVERRSWAKFGNAADDEAGSGLAVVSNEEIIIERPRPTGRKAEEPKVGGDSSAQQKKGGAVLMVCRTRGKKSEHWKARCSYKALAPDSADNKPAARYASGSAYVPSCLRPGPGRSGTNIRRLNDVNCLRVTNLSEDTRDSDLHELFRPFGGSRAHVVVDQKTGASRGFGFVKFVARWRAQKAIDKLDGYAYDNLILRVEWATPPRIT